MEPTINPTSNPTPNPVPGPVPTPDPVMPPEPVPTPGPVTSEPTPVSEPAPAVGPAPAPEAPVPPVAPVNPAPVNPVVTPGNPAPTNPVFQPGGVGVAATDPIMMPEQPKAPDPIEEELKAPMKAAGPVPGSIGSAVSGPSDGGAVESAANPFVQSNTQSVAFNDPAEQPEVKPGAAKPKAKSNKTTLIALIIVAVMIVIGLVAVLAWQLMNPAGGSSSGNGSGSSSQNSSQNSSNNSSNSSSNNSTPSQTDNNNSNNSAANNGSSNGNTTPSSGGTNAAETITFQDLQSEVDKDSTAVDTKYSGKTVSFTDVPLYVSEGSSQGSNIVLGKMFFNLACNNESSLPFSLDDNGKNYTITGTVTYVGSTGVSMSNCTAVAE